MKPPEQVVQILNEQVTHERKNESVYLACAAIFDRKNLLAMRDFALSQAKGENYHSLKIAEYLGDRNALAIYDVVPQSFLDENITCRELFLMILGLEQGTTQKIKDIYQTALGAADSQTAVFIEWFLTEQVEEEKTSEEILSKFDVYPTDGFVDDYIRENAERLIK